jgi:serpin B
VAIVGALVACATGETDARTPTTTAKSAVSRDLAPSLTPDELTALSDGQAEFAVSLYHAIANATPAESVFLSPHSASIALGMAYAGARGTTASEMRTALHLGLPDERVHAGFDYLDLELASRGPFELTITNSIWAAKDLPLVPSFLDTLAMNYGAGVNLVDFAGSPDGSRSAINEWVADQTAGRINDLLEPGSVKASTRAALVDAVYFHANWQTKFKHEDTRSAPFARLDGSSVTVPLMGLTTTLPYAKGKGYEAVALPYEGGELSMLVVVPDTGTFASFDAALTGAKVLEIANELTPTQLYVGYPKHHVEGSYDLKGALQSLGMIAAFGGADFSGMTAEPLRIDGAVQKTFVDVDETGTEAAAATAITFADASASFPPPLALTIDRPFLEAIFDAKTKSLVFLGRILEPKAKR